MKRLWVTAGCLIALAGFADLVPQHSFPEWESTTYKQYESPITDWIFEHWAAVGYAVPRDGEHFVWREYVVDVADLSTIQAGDGVMYLKEDGVTSKLALVLEAGSGDDTIAVMEPLPGGLVIIHGVDRSRIQSAFRPVRKIGDKAAQGF